MVEKGILYQPVSSDLQSEPKKRVSSSAFKKKGKSLYQTFSKVQTFGKVIPARVSSYNSPVGKKREIRK